MKLWEAANTSDHQHLAEAPLDCTTPYSKGSTWTGPPKHGKARDDPRGVGLRFGSRFGQTQGDSPLLSVTGASMQSDQGSDLFASCVFTFFALSCSILLCYAKPAAPGHKPVVVVFACVFIFIKGSLVEKLPSYGD